jgi:hypothetical protein
MLTMIDQLFDRHYREGRAALNSAILDFAGSFAKSVGETFAVLNRIEYSAPWTAKPKRIRSH